MPYTGAKITIVSCCLYSCPHGSFIQGINSVRIRPSSSDQSLSLAIAFARIHHKSHRQWVSKEAIDPETGDSILMNDLSWIPDNWWYLVTGKKRRQSVPDNIDRRQFELCLFSELAKELNSADMCVVGSEDFGDPRSQFIEMKEVLDKLPEYENIVGLPTDTEGFIKKIKDHIGVQAQKLNSTYPDNNDFRVDSNGDLWFSKLKAKQKVSGVDELTEMIRCRMPHRNILDIIVDTVKTINWCKPFGPITGLESKIKDPPCLML